MEQSRTQDGRPSTWTWVLGTILVVAIVWLVFATIGAKLGSHNERLPHAQIPAGSMVASSRAPSYPAAFSSASKPV